MNGADRQQAYDRGSTIFSPDGRLYQVEYAREAVTQGAPSVGVRTEEGVVLAAHKPRRSPLVERDSVEKLHAVDDQVAVATAGHAADGRRLLDVARRVAQREQLRYGEAIDVEPLASAIADHVQEQTQQGGTRPYGVALLFGGVDPDGTPRLFEVDPSGTVQGWRATAIGRDGDAALDRFEADHEADLGLDAGLELALEGLADAAEDLSPAEVAATTVDADGRTTVADERVAEALPRDKE